MHKAIIQIDTNVYYKGYNVDNDAEPIIRTKDKSKAHVFRSVSSATYFNKEVVRNHFEYSEVIKL